MVRINKSGHRGRYNHAHTGKFAPTHPEKFAGDYQPIYKSGLELKFMRYCDRNPMILKWDYEGLTIKYLDKSTRPEKVRNYHIDFTVWVRTKDGPKKLWVEVKQQSEVNKPVNESDVRSNKLWLKNQCKWRQAKVTALQNDAEFKIITENQLD